MAWIAIGAAMCLSAAVGLTKIRQIFLAYSERPSAEWLVRYQGFLDQDGIPVRADTVVACELDPNVCVGEGVIATPWGEFLKRFEPDADLADLELVTITTKGGDLARIYRISDRRVRILAGPGVSESVAERYFVDEMKAGKGLFPVYRSPEMRRP